MTDEEVKHWYDNMSEEKRLQIIREYHELRHGLCARILCVATGTDDWLQRAVHRATELVQCETQLRVLLHAVSSAVEVAQMRAQPNICPNCMGKKLVHGESCCICKGTGLRPMYR